MMRLPALALATLLLQADALTPRPDGHANVLQAADACIDVTIVMNTKKWASEVSWTITSPSNSAVSVAGSGYANNKEVYKQACLPVASGYLLTMIDSYGDGWNGGKIRVYLGTLGTHDALPSSPEVTGELPSGSQGTQSFALPLPAAPSAPAPAPDALDIALEAKLAEWNLLGFSVAYFKRGAYSEPIARGYGKTDANPSKASPVTGDTVQMIASMSKTILGATVAKLIDSGDIGLDDDIKNTLPSDWPAVGTSRNPKDSSQKPVTWRHILTHTSSMRRDVSDMSRSYGPTATLPSYLGKKGNPTCPVDDLIGFYGDYLIDRSPTTPVGAADGGIDWYESAKSKGTAWFDYKPGDAYEYSNLATGYLGLLVELAAKKSTNFPSHLSYEQFSKHTVFDPLQMTNTAWFRKDLPSSCSEATPADWYNGKHENIGHYCFIDYASGQLHTSARDLAKFGQSWIDYGKGFISPATGKQAVGCTSRAADGSIPADDDCKMGHLWFRLTNGKRDKGKSSHLDPVRALDWTDGVGHGGAEMGIRTQIVILPKPGVVAVVLANGKGFKNKHRDMSFELLSTLLDAAPLTYDGTHKTWKPPPSPPPMSSVASSCCTTVKVAAGVDAAKLEDKFPFYLGEYTLTHEDTTANDGTKRGVYKKAGLAPNMRGTTLAFDKYFKDWRIFDTSPLPTHQPATISGSEAKFYTWGGNNAACPQDGAGWEARGKGRGGYTAKYQITVTCVS